MRVFPARQRRTKIFQIGCQREHRHLTVPRIWIADKQNVQQIKSFVVFVQPPANVLRRVWPNASTKLNGGLIPLNLLANIDFPDPGGPLNNNP